MSLKTYSPHLSMLLSIGRTFLPVCDSLSIKTGLALKTSFTISITLTMAILGGFDEWGNPDN